MCDGEGWDTGEVAYTSGLGRELDGLFAYRRTAKSILLILKVGREAGAVQSRRHALNELAMT